MNRYIFVLVAIFSVACAAKLDWRIAGGSIAEDGQFPYQVSIQQFDNHFCSGSILNEQWVLTSAHCVVDYIPSHLVIVTGSNKLDPRGQRYRVTQTIVHNEYDWFTLENDIALMKIKVPIAFNEKVQPIPLETSDVSAGADVIVSGWGTNFVVPGFLSNDLQFLPLKAISSDECNSRHVADSGRGVGSTHLCTLNKRGAGACYGDNGGPLTHNGKVAGILSWGHPCAAGYPDVYTRVSSYDGWINETMK